MPGTYRGVIDWSEDTDAEGQRTYKLTHRVELDDPAEGPEKALNTPGLPLVGSFWLPEATGGDPNFEDRDEWAICTPQWSARPEYNKEKNVWWKVTQVFSTQPTTRCQDATVEDPLLEPQKISGSFVKYTEEVAFDKDGNLITNSAHELIRGPQVQFDKNKPTVRIQQNVSDLQLPLVAALIDKVNNADLWGLSTRMVKLSNVSWERKFNGTCVCYFTRSLEFDIDFNTFDRVVLDEGTKALGHWDPDTGDWVTEGDATNPGDFNRYKDKRGENARVILDGAGIPVENEDEAESIEIQFYQEANLLLLEIPTILSCST